MKLPAMVWLIAGFVGWALAFIVIYGLHGIGCAYGWDNIPVGPTSLHRLVQVATWLAFLPPLLTLALWLSRQRRHASPGSGRRWLALVGETTAWAGLAATIITFAPTVTTSACV